MGLLLSLMLTGCTGSAPSSPPRPSASVPVLGAAALSAQHPGATLSSTASVPSRASGRRASTSAVAHRRPARRSPIAQPIGPTGPSPTSRTVTGAATRRSTAGSAGPTGFVGTMTPIDPGLARRLTYTWHEGCPVPRSALSYLRMTYVDFDGRDHQGEMVVATAVAPQVITAFRQLYDARWPIRRMRLVDDFRGSDDASMAADNTSGFNCRRSTGGTRFSQHSYGRAVDLDPLENPYVGNGQVLPPAGTAFVGRPDVPGVIHDGDAATTAFGSIGWAWGGNWSAPQDFQHFSANGH
ncbi:D-alanyl-D-alanine carboxypeptidase [Nakamurella panacisegetis]|uniref:D-alanyl-D-alanine carboxypeptidase n=2 Tax=Nakamurella panacisegetis TaxID=1090615 RepID=A0A1H0NLR8_9ACTN|nr:D-alanyl-D-alanine carboxypeptidase [Nakamurella panacisegetis]